MSEFLLVLSYSFLIVSFRADSGMASIPAAGKSVTLKDIHNMAQKKHGGLTELIDEMKNQPGNVIYLFNTPNTSRLI